MAQGEFASLRKYLEFALNKTASWVGEHDLYAMLADAAGQQRDAPALHRYAPLAEESASRYGHKLYIAVAHRAWGVAHRLAGQSIEAEGRLQHALELFQQSEARWQVGRTFFELGDLAFSRAENTVAREHFSRALSAFEEMGALPDITRTAAKLALL